MLKEIDELIMKVWNNPDLSNELKNQIVMKLQEVEMLLQEGKL